MAHKKYGVQPLEWWKHMRFLKKSQNKKVRKISKELCK